MPSAPSPAHSPGLEKKLLLFDIDGTLLTSGGAGERALRRGFQARFGIDDDLARVEIAGRTDSGIARQMLAFHGLPETPENLAAFFDGYLQFLPEELPTSPGACCRASCNFSRP